MLKNITEQDVIGAIDLAETEVKTDDEIYQLALEEWLTILSRLWLAYDKPLDPVRLALYQHNFERVPMGLLEKAVDRAIRDNRYNMVPTVGNVWDAVRKELHNPYDIDEAIKRWQASLGSCFYRFESVTTETE